MAGAANLIVWTVPLGDGEKADRRSRAGEALRRVLAQEAGPDVRLVEDQGGKPRLRGGSLEFNLSHSGALALIATSRSGPVGVDVEAPRELRRPDRLAARICTERELAWIAGDSRRLLWLWVRKEAVAKADGRGLPLVLARIDVLDGTVSKGGWQVHDLALPDGYLGAVAAPAGTGAPELRALPDGFGR